MTLGNKVLSASAILLAVTCTFAQAVPLSIEAVDNATVQPAGPRPPASGKAFFNVEGSANGNFASYGVADFDFGNLPMTVIGINSASISLTHALAAFSSDGPLAFSLDQSAALADIQNGTSPLAFDGVDPGTDTDVSDGDLSLNSLGPLQQFTQTASGNVDTYNLTLNAAAIAELISRLNAGDPIRIVVGTGFSTVAATYAGNTNSTYEGPRLNLDVEYDTSTPVTAESWGRIKAGYR